MESGRTDTGHQPRAVSTSRRDVCWGGDGGEGGEGGEEVLLLQVDLKQ